MIERRVDSRDVLDPNAWTRASFGGRVVGRYERTGPNSWDDYQLTPVVNEPPITVLAGIGVQVEPDQPIVRVRHHGQVLVVEWLPTPGDQAEMKRSQTAARDFFVAHHLEDYSSPPGWGLAAVLQQKLKDDDERGVD
jgi:hypothetical protein